MARIYVVRFENKMFLKYLFFFLLVVEYEYKAFMNCNLIFYSLFFVVLSVLFIPRICKQFHSITKKTVFKRSKPDLCGLNLYAAPFEVMFNGHLTPLNYLQFVCTRFPHLFFVNFTSSVLPLILWKCWKFWKFPVISGNFKLSHG